MDWRVETHPAVDAEIETLPLKLRARLLRLLEAIQNVGLEALPETYAKHLGGKLWELRVRAQGGIARGLYVTRAERRVAILHVFAKKSRRTPLRGPRNCQRTYEAGDAMTRLDDLKSRLLEDPDFRREYARVDEEFALIEALIRARTTARLTQEELARRLGTTQSAIARLEGGRVSPSFATLRRYAEATGTRLTVGLVPADG